MLYRLARPDDAETLVLLNAAFNEVDDVSPEDVRHSLLNGAETVVVAEHESAVVAFCCAQVHHSFCYKAPVAEVTEMYVDEAHRRLGCASGMLCFLVDHLRSAFAVGGLHLLTSTGNHTAQSVYRKAGFTIKDEVYMVKSI